VRIFGRNRTSNLLPAEAPPVTAAADLPLEISVVANMSVGVALVSATDGEIVYVNDCWERMFGYDPGELLGRHISVVNAATDQTPGERAREIFDGLTRDGVWNGDVQNVHKDGTPFWTSCSVSAYEHPEHGVVWVSVNTEITARKQEDSRLRDEVQRYRRVFDASPAGLALIAADLRLELVNQAFCDILGYSRDELQGTLLSDLTHPDDVALCTELRNKVLSGETPRYRIEERLLTRQRGIVPVALTATVIRGPDGAPIAEVATIEKLEGDER
jgi:PAS domain S-box-containing protein